MKRIRNLTMYALTAFLLIGSLPVMAVERSFPVNGQGVTSLSSMEQATYSVPM
jgi:hypothetical protein